MAHQQILSGLIALLTGFVSTPSCADADALSGPTVQGEQALAFNEQGGPRVAPLAPGIDITEEAVGDSVVRYLVRVTTADDGRGKVQNYLKRVVTIIGGDTLYHAVSSDTAFVVDVPRPLLAADTTLFETAAIRRGLTSDTVRVKRPIQPRADQPPPPPEIDVDTVPTDTVGPTPIPPSNVGSGIAEMPRVYVNTDMPAFPGPVVKVEAGGNLQAALNAVERGGTVELAAGATFTGNFVLPAKPGSAPILIRSSGTLPPEGQRVTPASAAGFARIVTTNSMPALRTAAGGDASHYRLVGVEIASTATMTYSIVHLGDYDGLATDVSMLPASITLDRVYVHGTATNGIQRCVTLNVKAGAVIDSDLRDCHIKGFDSQAIVAWQTPGPLKVVNSRLEGAGENLMIGGADPRIPNLVGSDIEIRRNYFVKPLEWKASGAFTVKNLFELKNARRVLVEDNIFENNWADGQDGFAIVLKSINDGGKCTWCVTEDVTFRHNRIINSPSGFNLVAVQAYNGGGAIPMRRVVISQVEMVGVGFPADGSRQSGANYRMFQMLGNLTSMHVSNVTSLGVASPASNQVIMFSGLPTSDTRFTNNLLAKTTYGIFGDSRGEGNGAITYYAPGSTITGNALIGANCGIYPAGNTCPAIAPSTPGVDRAALDQRLAGVK